MPKILVVDDDPDIITAVTLILESAGYEVSAAANSAAALACLAAEPHALIILDVMMDTTTEGFQFALKLRSPNPVSAYQPFRKIPILMLTAIHSTTPVRFGPDEDYLPVDAFLEKPIDHDDLLSKVAGLLTE